MKLLITQMSVLLVIFFASSATYANTPTQTKIQMAILLDTSSSMDGLIDQARQQLWNVVDEFSRSKRDGMTPRLEVAVFEYGNDNLSAESGFTRRVLGFTSELDRVSEALYGLTTNGGSEYCGLVIDKALSTLQWSQSQDDLKTIFIAGNEPFTQGPVAFQHAIELAKNASVFVNTVHAGDYTTGVNQGWKDAAMLAGGNFMSIDHNHQLAHIEAPQDQRIAELNAQLNATYIPYGDLGEESLTRQNAQDEHSKGVSVGLLAKRVKSKVSKMYENTSWDLVDAEESGVVDLDNIEQNQLPSELRDLNKEDMKVYVEEKARTRKDIQNKILELHAQRAKYVEAKKSESVQVEAVTLKNAISEAVRQQGEAKGYEFRSEE